MNNLKHFLALAILFLLGSGMAQSQPPLTPSQEKDADARVSSLEGRAREGLVFTLFNSASSPVPYRIPAIAKTKSGRLVAVADYRICQSDIGFGRVDLRQRISKDNGRTWSTEQIIVEGSGVEGTPQCGYGDPAIVADRNSKEVLLLCVCGNTPYFKATRDNPNRVARLRSHDGGRTWSAPEEITDQIYSLFDQSALGPVQSLFVGSGKICQSRIVKRDKYYRIYAALCARPGGNRVIYSDDFGETWHSLGTIDSSPAPLGDEPKVEELPNGDVLLSSRPGWGNMNSGRFYNIFHYPMLTTFGGNGAIVKGKAFSFFSNENSGQWEQAVASADCTGGVKAKDNVTNGEILIIPAVRQSDRIKTWIALQSVPLGPGRKNVAVYYKELASPADYQNATAFASGWSEPWLVSANEGAYSTMIVQKDLRLAFYWEDTPDGKGGYQMLYRPLTLDQITAGKYKAR